MLRPIFIILVSLFLSIASYADNNADQTAALMNFLKGVKIDKKQIAGMLDMMAAQGKITKEQAAEAKKKLESQSEADIQKLQETAVKKIKDGSNLSNLNGQQRKMIEDMKKRIELPKDSKN